MAVAANLKSRNSKRSGLDAHLSLALALSTIQVDIRFWLDSTPILRENTVVKALPPLFPFHQFHDRTCGLTAMPSPKLEPRPYGTAVSVTNHYTGRATEIGQRVERNQATLCDADLSSLDAGGNDGLTGRSHPPRCTTVCDERWIVLIAVVDRAATSRTIAQQIQSVTHHSVFALTIRRRLQQSGTISRRPLLHLPLTGNHRHCTINGAKNGGHGQRNGTILCLLTNPASACNITMVGFEFEDIVERGC
ncbi:transposable element Tcb1 transposase [Trichonephila clavipes]|nr:transposable element Tcb1 transposase [Trichonephila clavipes]